MDQLVQCPVCTLYLHNGMSLESHLDTHPKDQVIKALCSLSANRPYGSSRSTTPMNSERSFRSRSHTPAAEESNAKWSNSHTTSEHERYWRRTPSRTPKSSTVTRSNTPDIRMNEVSTDSANTVTATPVYPSGTYPGRLDKLLPPYEVSVAPADYEQPYQYLQDQREEKEIKYSRSAEYNSLHSTSNVYAYNMAPGPSSMKLHNALLPSPVKRSEVMLPNKKQTPDFLKILPPKTKNIALLKTTNMGSVQYLAPAVMVSTGPTFVQKNSPNSLIVTANIQNSTPSVQSKSIATPLSTNHYSQMSSSSFAPNTTVVTKNSHSQIIYSEMVHNVDGKRFLPSVPAVLSTQESVTNVAQTSSMYQNVMVLDQFGNTSCMYTPQQLLPKPATSMYNQISTNIIDNKLPGETNKTLIIEVGPIESPPPTEAPKDLVYATPAPRPEVLHSEKVRSERRLPEKPEPARGKVETPGPTKGLKILSNIKVEVPVQHHKNLLNTIVDLTVPSENDYTNRSKSPEHILPDIEMNQASIAQEQPQPSVSTADVSVVSNTFSVIKNVGNPPSYKDSKQPDSKIHENESSDSCPVPDLICNEKPSISPCSELSDNGDNATAHTPILPKLESSHITLEIKEIKKETIIPVRNYRSNPLRLNNIYVKKNKKVLQIKNAKTFPVASTSTCGSEARPGPSRASPRLPEDFTVTKIHTEKSDNEERTGRLETVSINKITEKDEDQRDFDADTEEQSMDMELEPTAESSYAPQLTTTIDLTRVKDEVNSSNDTGMSDREFTELESLRPINVVQPYNNIPHDFDDDSNHRELLDLEAASKNRQFVSMMNDNYFGDNIYADYFTPDRVESFDTVREPLGFNKDGRKVEVYLWGESSQKENEFVLPNFIHESYRIAESHGSYALAATEGDGGDSKADVLSESRSESEAPLNICADERMPPRGELSGQESNGDMESSWTGIYPEVPAPVPCDLIARESWLSDGSDMDSNDNNPVAKQPDRKEARAHACGTCPQQFAHARELRAHRALAHAPAPAPAPAPAGPPPKNYSRIMSARAIKKEEKPDDAILTGMLQDSKAGITSTVLEAYEALADTKLPIKTIKQENKRKRRDYICPTCKVDQVTDVAFHEHLKVHPLECLTCGKCFFRRANLALHIKTHLGIKNYKCEVCEKRFMTRQRLFEHHNVHTGRAPVKCTLCDHTFRRYSNMVQHRDRHHFHKKPKIRDYVCHCGEVFHSRAKLRWHAETHDGKPKACQYCSDKFVHASSLTRHVRRTHNAFYTRGDARRKTENVPCPVCKQVYLRTNLKTHMRTHSGKRPHVCMICNKAFTTQWNLKLHRWTHMGRSAKPYKCGLCKGAFIRQSEYVSHMNAHKSVRPYTCNYCGCQFIRKYNCQRHVREHETAKKYVCKVPDCGKSFHRSYYLSEHMKVHSGARPFTCNICGKTSSHKSNHNKHVRIHHAREPVATEA